MAFTMAMMQVMPGGTRPNRARAWLYYRVLERGIEQAPDNARGEARQLSQALAPMRRMIDGEISEAERAEAERLLLQWQIVRSPVTLRADQGLDAARRLVGMAPAA